MDFREIEHYLNTGEKLPEPNVQEVRDILLKHLQNLHEFYGEHTGVRVARKHISWYSKGQPHGAAFRKTVNNIDNFESQLLMVHQFFERLIAKEEMAA